jgi:hypothetical protein
LLSSWLPIESEKCFFISTWVVEFMWCVFLDDYAMKGKGKWKLRLGKTQDEQDEICLGERKMIKMTYV